MATGSKVAAVSYHNPTTFRSTVLCGAVLALAFATVVAQDSTRPPAGERPAVVLKGKTAEVTIELGGGSIPDFHLREQPLNPFTWNPSPQSTAKNRAVGHFLCLDRWGAPSEAEGKRGMYYHGEATRVPWEIVKEVETSGGKSSVTLAATLPIAQLKVTRKVDLLDDAGAFLVTETVTNLGPLGRVYNMVQHPSISPPFLDEATIVDCNGTRGFSQENPVDALERNSFHWPAATVEGKGVDLRHMTTDRRPAVTAFIIEEDLGWATAVNAKEGLLVGFVWKTKEYPWVNMWREVQRGKPAARGLEFGTTGVHQPFGKLIEQGRVLGRPLVAYLDSGESSTRSYTCFLLKTPTDFRGVESLSYRDGTMRLKERDGPRELTMTLGALP
jgi:hypothetical protein